MMITSEFLPLASMIPRSNTFRPIVVPSERAPTAGQFKLMHPDIVTHSSETHNNNELAEIEIRRQHLGEKVAQVNAILDSINSCSLFDSKLLSISLRQTVYTLVSAITERLLIGDAAFLDSCIAKTMAILGTESGTITLHLHPDDYALIEAEHDTHYTNLQVQCDAMMARGTVRLVSPVAEVIDGLDHRLAILKNAVLDKTR